jgi:hypothetical protein
MFFLESNLRDRIGFYTELDDESTLNFIDVLDECTALLHKRGVINLFKVISKIRLVEYNRSVHDKYQLASYSPSAKWLSIISNPKEESFDFENQYREYVNLVIHEVGHAIQTNLSNCAKEYWSRPWTSYENLELENSRVFFDSLIDRLFQCRGVIEKFLFKSEEDYLKVATLLSNYLHLNTANWKDQVANLQRLSWNSDGIKVFKVFFSNPKNKENKSYDEIPYEIMKAITKPDIKGKLVDLYFYRRSPYLDMGLASPSHTNQYEDFAESFRLYLLEPNRLPLKDTARLLQTLWLDRFYGGDLIDTDKFIRCRN